MSAAVSAATPGQRLLALDAFRGFSWTVDSWGPFDKLLTAWLVIAFQIYARWRLYRRQIFLKR